LRKGRDDDLVDVDVRRPRHREQHAVGHVLRRDRPAERHALVDRVGFPLVAAEADEREVGLHHARRERRDADRAAEEILAQRLREPVDGVLRRDVEGAVRVRGDARD
jgi:hypothetical protein